jgi:hypothetical protein
MLNKRILRDLLSAALLLLLCTPHPLDAADFLLFYSNDVHGETEPCG